MTIVKLGCSNKPVEKEMKKPNFTSYQKTGRKRSL
tara:strand:+ start:224 stop:328 length:105 start_codon:yes stop_codon:yes gene_type:complete